MGLTWLGRYLRRCAARYTLVAGASLLLTVSIAALWAFPEVIPVFVGAAIGVIGSLQATREPRREPWTDRSAFSAAFAFEQDEYVHIVRKRARRERLHRIVATVVAMVAGLAISLFQ